MKYNIFKFLIMIIFIIYDSNLGKSDVSLAFFLLAFLHDIFTEHVISVNIFSVTHINIILIFSFG